MADLERISPRPDPADIRPAEPGRMRHPPRQQLPRHVHDHGFAAVVLAGGYVEAGDTGRHWVEPGDVLLHQAWESHLDRVGRCGAEVLVVPIADDHAGPVAGRLADPDMIARLAEHDRQAAACELLTLLTPRTVTIHDWPDLLAQALRADPLLSLGAWASGNGLHLGSVSRGFRQIFGLTPVRYRLIQRTRRAIGALRWTREPLSLVAQDCGFADQSHMTRAIRGLARTTPGALRRRIAA